MSPVVLTSGNVIDLSSGLLRNGQVTDANFEGRPQNPPQDTTGRLKVEPRHLRFDEPESFEDQEW